MRNVVAQTFTKGINARIPLDRFDDPSRLYRIQNARLTARGDTYYVRRMEGAVPIGEGYYPVCLDVLNFRNYTIVLYKNQIGSENHYVDIVNNEKPEEAPITLPFAYRGESTRDVGKLLVIEDTILIAPHNKQLNFIDGVWRLNDFVSTTPTLDISPQIASEDSEQQEAGFAEGHIQVLSGVANNTTPGSKATVRISVKDGINGNTLGLFIDDISLGGATVINSTIVLTNPGEYDSQTAIRDAIVNALNVNATFTTNWIATGVDDDVVITALNNGVAFNNVVASIEVSADSPNWVDQALVQTFFEVGGTGGLSGNTSGGADPGTYAGIQVSFGNKTFTTSTFPAGAPASEVLAQLLIGFQNTLSTQDYDIAIIGDRVNIKAKRPGSKYNYPGFTITNPPLVFLVADTIDGGTNITDGDLVVGDTIWYAARNVYRDGHKTKTGFPVKFVPEEFSNKAEIVITPSIDIDGGFADVELFRKIGSGDFYFIKKVRPQATDEDAEGYVDGGFSSFKNIYVTDEAPDEEKKFTFSLGDYTTPEISYFPEDTKEDFLEKIYNAFFLLDGFASDWNIELTSYVSISSKIASAEFNDLNIVVTGDLRVAQVGTQMGFTTNGSVSTTDEILTTPTLVNIYPNDVLRIGTTLVTAAEFVPMGSDSIPITEVTDIPALSDITFLRGEYFSRYGYIQDVPGENPTIKFVDDGLVDLYLLDEKDYIWSELHKTHEIVRDRYVRANVKFENKDLGLLGEQFRVTEQVTEPGENTSPFYSNTILYAQGRYKDGTTSFFGEIGRFDTTIETERLSVIQDLVTNEDVKEYGFYAKYTPKRSPFAEAPSFGFANLNLPTELTSKRKETDGVLEYVRQPVYPANPRLFLGFTRITVQFLVGAESPFSYTFMTDTPNTYEWQINEENPFGGFLFNIPTNDNTPNFPDIWDIPFGSDTIRYKKDTEFENTATYVLLSYIGIKNLIDKIDLFYEIDTFQAAGGASFGGASQTQLDGLRLKIVNYTVVKAPDTPGNDGALFISLESGSVLDSVTATISKPIAGIGTSGLNVDRHPFNTIFGFSNSNELPGWHIDSGPKIGGRIVGMAFDDIGTVFGIDRKIDQIIYLGRKDNEIDTEATTLPSGYDTKYIEERLTQAAVGIYYSSLRSDNIFSSLLLETDIPFQKENYPNQIIWSEPFVLQSAANGHRNFVSTSFLNMAPDYGDIVGLEYVQNRLLVFCERGVAVVNVGEVLTQQVGGEVFVDTSTFLNGYYWALKALPMVMPKTIVQYENRVFFCDGVDVWMYDGEFKNISNGAIVLRGMGFGGTEGPGNPDVGPGPGEGTGQQPGEGPGSGGTSSPGGGVFMGSEDWYWGSEDNYMGQDSTSDTTPGSGDGEETPDPENGDDEEPTNPQDGSGPGTQGIGTWVGIFDPYNKEYRISDNYLTFSYSTEIAEWTGPHTYRDQGSDFIRNRTISVMDARLVEHNIGRTFNGFEYETIIESVGNVMDRPDMVKLWRKFYIDLSVDGKSPGQYNPNVPVGTGSGIYMGSEDFYWGEENEYMGDDGSGSSGGGGSGETPDGAPNTLGVNRVFFGYRKELYLSYKDVDLGLAKVRNNRYNVGVVNAHQNSEQLYWRIRTKEPNFVVKLVAFEFFPRGRR